MKTIAKLLFLIILLITVSHAVYAQDGMEGDEYVLKPKELADGTLYGEDITKDSKAVQINDIITNLDTYKDKNVIVEGTVAEVCQEMGCWLVISDGTTNIRVMTLHKFFVPKDMGKVKVVAEGKFEIKEITEEQARHFNDESKDSKIKSEDIKGPQKTYRITTTGIKVLK